VTAVQRGGALSTAARRGAPGWGTKRIRDELRYIWGLFDFCDKAFSPQSRSNQVFCKSCRSAGKAYVPINRRVDTMYYLFPSCLAVPLEDREAASVAGELELQHRTLASNASLGAEGPGVVFGPMDALVSPNYSASQTEDFETDLLKWMLFSCIAYDLLESPLFRLLIHKWMPGIKNIPKRHAVSSTVLERLLGSLSAPVKTVYSKGAFVSFSFHSWISGGGRKLMGMLAGLVSKNTGEVSVDFRGTSDITALPETSELVVSNVKLELERDRADNDYLPPHRDGTSDATCASVLAGIVSDWVSCKVAVKVIISDMFPSIIMVACMAHQLNLLTANIITHPALQAVTRSGCVVVKLFTQSTKWMGQLEIRIDQVLQFRRMLIKSGNTRWYSHFGMVKRTLVGGSAIALLSLISGDLGATQCSASSKPQPTTWKGRSGIWRHNKSVRMACPTAKAMSARRET